MRNLDDIRAGANCIGCIHAVDHNGALGAADVRCHRFPPTLSMLSPFRPVTAAYPPVTNADVCGEYSSAGS